MPISKYFNIVQILRFSNSTNQKLWEMNEKKRKKRKEGVFGASKIG